MAKVTEKTLEEYRRMLQRDPSSKVFAPLAEAYRDMAQYTRAEQVASDGIRRHPGYASGYVVLGRILSDQDRHREAFPVLKKAADLDPENLLALQLLAKAYLQLDLPKDALKIYKRVLFLNPQSENARSAVQRLETLSADEYEEDIFQYQNLTGNTGSQKETSRDTSSSNLTASQTATRTVTRTFVQNSNEKSKNQAFSENEVERKLSLVDALIVRHELDRAREILTELSFRAPSNAEIAKRFELLDEEVPEEAADLLHPLQSREKTVIERKKRLLTNLLRRIKEHNEGQIINSSNG